MFSLWFGDAGMLVLHAGNKSFRLPSCILAEQSSAIRNFLFYPNLATIQAEKHTCPAAGLSITLDDPEEAVEHFLRAVYDSGYFEPPPTPASLDKVLGVLSLGAKYDVPFLRKRSLKHLETGYPSSLQAYEFRKSLSTFSTAREYGQAYSERTEGGIDIEATLSVLQVAHAIDARWILPSAYYECCMYSLKDILTHPKYLELDTYLRDRIMIGYTNQLSATHHIAGFLYESSAEACKEPFKCLEVRRSYAETAGWINNCTDPIGTWEPGDWQWYLWDCCDVCIAKAKKTHAEAKEVLWDRLPDLYGLPAWEILLAERQHAMA
ncbi:hypothetical protein NLJ89_g5411 [Agrocybe chaxingu]|uniref:BTB domain-containing protein n=1 Tax=Agrocybe chaxingu TaxID=84603 RepID=A0A9W8MWY3_9AGAR|nr:hypothetical protein NLJ89_g5411 [Agrocybe chaxingu]